eukprot:13351154-Alexandrium_andersonii.AAC.1
MREGLTPKPTEAPRIPQTTRAGSLETQEQAGRAPRHGWGAGRAKTCMLLVGTRAPSRSNQAGRFHTG